MNRKPAAPYKITAIKVTGAYIKAKIKALNNIPENLPEKPLVMPNRNLD